MGLIFTLIGSLFLLNPNFRMLDYLPDFIGCILILVGLSKIYAIDGRIEAARKQIMYLTAVSAIKFPLSFYIVVKAKYFLLPVSFAASVVEIITMSVFFINLFGGLQYLTSRSTDEKRHIDKAENASVICFIFSIARGVLGFAPEILSLGEQKDKFDYSYTPTPEQNAALIKPYAEMFCFIAIFIFGIFTAVLLGRYIIGLVRDKEFSTSLRERCTQYEKDNIQTFNIRRTKTAMLILFFGVLLLYNQILDSVNVIPNVLSFIFLAIGWARLRKCDNASNKPLLVFIPLSALSIYNNIVQYKLLSGTDIRILGTDLSVREVPEILTNTDAIVGISGLVFLEYAVIAVMLVTILRRINKLPFLKDDGTISFFEILLVISGAANLISSVYIHVGPFIRTANTAITNSIDAYIHYDNIQGIFEWVFLASFIIMLFSAYKYGSDTISRIKVDN